MRNKIVSWNLNGLKSAMRENNFINYFNQSNADFFCVQETKVHGKEANLDIPNYKQYWNNSKSKNGYSGTCIFTKQEPLNVEYGLKDEYGEEVDNEGRVITLDYPDFYLVNVYVPNPQMNLQRKNYRLEFDTYFLNHIENLNNKKNTIVCGDFNIAYKNNDKPKEFSKNTELAFSDEDRASFQKLLDIGLIDTYRKFHPQFTNYTWFFSNNEEKKNIGWRLDYSLVSEELEPNIKRSIINSKVTGSDHKPIELEIEI